MQCESSFFFFHFVSPFCLLQQHLFLLTYFGLSININDSLKQEKSKVNLKVNVFLPWSSLFISCFHFYSDSFEYTSPVFQTFLYFVKMTNICGVFPVSFSISVGFALIKLLPQSGSILGTTSSSCCELSCMLLWDWNSATLHLPCFLWFICWTHAEKEKICLGLMGVVSNESPTKSVGSQMMAEDTKKCNSN